MSAPPGIAEDTTEATPDVDGAPPAAAPVPRSRRRHRDGLSRWPLQRILLVTGAALGVLLLVALLVGIAGLTALAGQRSELVDRLDPALLTAQQLDAATVDQETGVRGYVLLPRPELLEPYPRGRADEAELVGGLRALVAGRPEALAQLERGRGRHRDLAHGVRRAVDRRRRAGRPRPAGRGRQGGLRPGPCRARRPARSGCSPCATTPATGSTAAADTLAVVGAVTLVVVALGVAGAAGVAAPRAWSRRPTGSPREVRQVVGRRPRPPGRAPPAPARSPSSARTSRRCACSSSASWPTPSGPARSSTAAAASSRARTPTSSSSPTSPRTTCRSRCARWRASASCCSAATPGQLDERADQYIEFAIDGAKRMQVLINDLLAFSRVGRQGDAMETVDLNRLVDRAAENVAGALEESGGAVEHGDLPRVLGAPALLTTVFQNLLGNSLKFRGEDPPRVRVDAERDGDRWLLRFARQRHRDRRRSTPSGSS